MKGLFGGFNLLLIIMVAIALLGLLQSVDVGVDPKATIDETPLKPLTPAIEYLEDKSTTPISTELWVILLAFVFFTFFVLSKNK